MILQRLAPFSRSERRTNASEVVVAYRFAQRKISFYQWRRFHILEKFTMDDMFRSILGQFWPRGARLFIAMNMYATTDLIDRWSLYTRSVVHSPFVISSVFLFLRFANAHASTNNRVSSARIPCPCYTSRYEADNFSSLFYFLIFPRVSFEIGTSC